MNSEENLETTSRKKDISELVASLGTIISVVNLYGLNHMISIDAMEKSFELLNKNLLGRKRISFNVVDNQLLIDMEPLNDNSNFVARFIERLAILEISGFTFAGGISEDEFIQFIMLLTSRDTATGNENFTKALGDRGLEHITASRAILREVLEDEDVAKKEDIKIDGDGDRSGGYDTETVQQVVAFLKGDIDISPPDILQNIEPEENNINKLSELIMNSVSISQRNPDLATGESIGNILVGCLRRTFNTQLKSSSARTKSGRKKISKSLLMMEQSVLGKLHDFAAGDDLEVQEQVSTCLGNMRDELKVDGIVSDFLKKKKYLDASKKELGKLLEGKDTTWVQESGLRDKLTTGGIEDREWCKLVVQSEDKSHRSESSPVEGVADMSDTLGKVLNDLSMLLEHFDTNSDPVMEQKVVESLELVSSEIDSVVDKTHEKINKLSVDLNNSSSNKHEWNLVKEIVQELCQPLSVISCTVDMLIGGMLGKLPRVCIPALELAADSSLRMKDLADRLVDVCGVPESLIPE